jgi:hypothetical protein
MDVSRISLLGNFSIYRLADQNVCDKFPPPNYHVEKKLSAFCASGCESVKSPVQVLMEAIARRLLQREAGS